MPSRSTACATTGTSPPSNFRSRCGPGPPGEQVERLGVRTSVRRRDLDRVVVQHQRAVRAALDVELDVVGAERDRRLDVRPGQAAVGADQASSAALAAYVAAARTRPGQQADVGGGLGVPLDADAEPVARSPPSPPGCRRRRARRRRSPGASRTDWWWWQLTVSRSPTSAGDPGAGAGDDRRPRRTRRRRGCAARGRPGPGRAGRARRRRAPPSPACPGTRRAPAGRPRRRRRAARPPRRRGPGASWRCAGAASSPYRPGSTSAPPLITSPSSRATTASRGAGLARPAAAARARRRSPRPRRRTASGSRSARCRQTPHAASSR